MNKNLLNIFIGIACVSVAVYFGIKIYKELAPMHALSYKEQQLHCLEMGSDPARRKCLQIIEQ